MSFYPRIRGRLGKDSSNTVDFHLLRLDALACKFWGSLSFEEE